MVSNSVYFNQLMVEYLESELDFLMYEIKRAERYIGMNEDSDSQKCSNILLSAIK